jgi:hypothetical protein
MPLVAGPFYREVPMVRPKSGPAGAIAAAVAAAIVSSIVVVLSVFVFADRMTLPSLAETAHQPPGVNRTNKTDSLPVPVTPQLRTEIKSVEVVGVRDAAIVYRDRNGNVLFRTDPVANVTVVAKNVDLPEVTIRDTATTKVERMSVERSTPLPPTPPHGCESSFARPSPEPLTQISSRCLAQIGAPTDVAALR